jgi:hypothetical protein
MTDVQKKKRTSKMSAKSIKLRNEFWADIPNDNLWDRTKHVGFTTIPRTMPIIMEIINNLSKGSPAGQTYFVLWCYLFDESVITIENPLVFAAETGFGGERATTTWKNRMKTLQTLGFINAKSGSSGEFHYVLVLNPYFVIDQIKNQIPESLYRQFYGRSLDVGAIKSD